jgi:hypothetical protein
MPDGATTCCSPFDDMPSLIMYYLMILLSAFMLGTGWTWLSSLGSTAPSRLNFRTMTRQCGHTVRAAWLALENRFIGNRETRALHIDATFRNFV